MALGLVLLAAVSVLILFGAAHRVLDRMYLSDGGALLFIVGMIVGSFIEIPLYRGVSRITLNLGGALLPLGLAVYVLARAGTAWERWRAVLAAIATTVAIYVLSKVMNFGEKQMFVEPLLLWAAIAAAFSYLVGRSRRTAFISATLSLIGLDIVHAIEAFATGNRAATRIGGGGGFDSIVLAGLLAVFLTEIFGEARERLGGGPADGPSRPAGLRREEVAQRLDDDRGEG